MNSLEKISLKKLCYKKFKSKQNFITRKQKSSSMQLLYNSNIRKIYKQKSPDNVMDHDFMNDIPIIEKVNFRFPGPSKKLTALVAGALLSSGIIFEIGRHTGINQENERITKTLVDFQASAFEQIRYEKTSGNQEKWSSIGYFLREASKYIKK